jgi:hypothetical protein
MSERIALAAGMALGAIVLSTVSLAALPLAQDGQALRQVEKDNSAIQLVQGGRCHRWRRECAARWGFRTSRYFRCMARNRC